MAGIDSSRHDPLDIDASTPSSKDRSETNARFFESLQVARNVVRQAPTPPVELHLSAEAKAYAERLGRNGKQSDEACPGKHSRAENAENPGHHPHDSHEDTSDKERGSQDDD